VKLWRELGTLLRDLGLGLVLPFLPERVRTRVADRYGMDLLGATILSGLLEIAIGIVVFYLAYRSTVAAWSAQTSSVVAEHADSIQQRVKSRFWNPYNLSLFSGSLLYIAFLITPKGMLSVFAIYEGIFRSVAAAATGETIGSAFVVLPWRLSAWLVQMGRRAADRALAKPALPDRVKRLRGRDGDGYLVESDTSKPDWREGLAVEIGECHYRLTRCAARRAGRKQVWRYLLRPWPAGEIIRRRQRYQPPSRVR